MREANRVAFTRTIGRAMLSLALLSAPLLATAGETPTIDQASLLKRIEKKDPSLIILDVRNPDEYAKGHVPGAINIPYTHLPARVSEIDGGSDKEIVLYCASGVRAERAATRFREHGYTRLLHLDGDMKKWEANKQPIEK